MNRCFVRVLLLNLLLVLTLYVPAQADTYIIQPGPEGTDTAYDCFHDSQGPNNYCEDPPGEANAPSLPFGRQECVEVLSFYDFFQFDLTGSPDATETTSVRFTFYVTDAHWQWYSDGQPIFELDRLTQPWTETTLTSRNAPQGQFILTMHERPTVGWHSLDITELYRGWKNGTYPNYGFKLQGCFYCSLTYGTLASSDNADPTIRPKLEITYAPPTTLLSGSVLFEDRLTPVPGGLDARGRQVLEIVARDGYAGFETTAPVDANGNYTFAAPLQPSFLNYGYHLYARYRIPEGFADRTYQAEFSIQPFDRNPTPDLQIDSQGIPSRTDFDFVFPWPVFLLHGMLPVPPPLSIPGPWHFNTLQRYLAGYDPSTGELPRWGFIPLVPNMGRGTYQQYYNRLGPQLRTLFNQGIFPRTAKYSIIGYCQGGLVARILLDARFNGVPVATRIAGVVQLGTPNHGTCVGDYFCDCVDGTHCDQARLLGCQWTEASLDAFNLGDAHSPPHNYLGARASLPGSRVPFYLIAGNQYESLSYPLYLIGNFNACLPAMGPSDSVVPVASVFHLQNLGYNVTGTEPVTATHYDTAANAAIFNSQRVRDLVYAWLIRNLGP